MSDVLKEVLRDKERAERFRKWDTALTNILEDPYGQYLGYYPPVFIAGKVFDFLRPYFLQICSKSDTTNLLDPNDQAATNSQKISTILGINPFGEDRQNFRQDEKTAGQSSRMNYEAAKGSGNDPVKSRYFDQSLINAGKKKNDKENPFDDSSSVASSTITDPSNPFADTEKTTKPKKPSIMRRLSMKKKDKKEKSLNPFDSVNGSPESNSSSQNDKTEQATSNGTGANKSPSLVSKILSPSFPKAPQNPKFLASLTTAPVVSSAEESFYPCDGSDIDSDDDSDAEGNYELNHDYDDAPLAPGDSVSLKSAASIRSIRSACDEESRELQSKLIENYVNDKDKQKYKEKSNSLGRNSLKRIFSKKGKKEKKEQS